MATSYANPNSRTAAESSLPQATVTDKSVAKSGIKTVLLTGFIGTLLSVVLASVFQPTAQIQDEFAYLLSAEIFASGNFTSPTHPHWQHFESMQIIHQPSYNSKYPPGQSLALAAGHLLGNPIFGACLTTGLSMAALMWMLMGWLPELRKNPKAAMFCMLLIVCHPGLLIVWGQSYMGGAVAMLGGALLLGALARFDNNFDPAISVVAAIGISLLVVSRPFEGAVLTLCCLIAVAWQLLRTRGWKLERLCTHAIVPFAVVGLLSGSVFLMYNQRVTGNPLTMPYSVHESTYGWNKVFLWQTPDSPPSYRHDGMQRFFENDVVTTRAKFGTLSDSVTSQLDTLLEFGLFFLGCSLIIGLAGVPYLLKQPKIKLALIILIPGLLTILVTPWGHSHYVAPFAPLIFLFAIGGLLELWKTREQFAMVKRWNWRLIAVMQLAWLAIIGYKSFDAEQTGWHQQRLSVQQHLNSRPGKDLVFVRYDQDHDVHAEWVYNQADIDGSDIVWAREMSAKSDAELVSYFSDRKVWSINADDESAKPEPYLSISPNKNKLTANVK
jgi:hypothetical protein